MIAPGTGPAGRGPGASPGRKRGAAPAAGPEIDRAYRLGLALACGHEGRAEALVEEGARSVLRSEPRGPTAPGSLCRGVVRAYLAGAGCDGSWEWASTGAGVPASLSLLSALSRRRRLAVVLRSLEGLDAEGLVELAGWSGREARALERAGLSRLRDAAMARTGWGRRLRSEEAGRGTPGGARRVGAAPADRDR